MVIPPVKVPVLELGIGDIGTPVNIIFITTMTGVSAAPNDSTRAYPNPPRLCATKWLQEKIELFIEKVLYSPALKARGDSQDQAGCGVERDRASGGRSSVSS
jgi:hypothetical protein